jgi:hypothetical protein
MMRLLLKIITTRKQLLVKIEALIIPKKKIAKQKGIITQIN